MAETTHQCPPDDQIFTPCCGLTPFDLPRTDRITLDPSLVTCHAALGLQPYSQDESGVLHLDMNMKPPPRYPAAMADQGTWPDDRRPVTVELRDGTWGCWACSAPARKLPDMTPAIVAGNPRAHVYAVIDHDQHCPHVLGAFGPGPAAEERSEP